MPPWVCGCESHVSTALRGGDRRWDRRLGHLHLHLSGIEIRFRGWALEFIYYRFQLSAQDANRIRCFDPELNDITFDANNFQTYPKFREYNPLLLCGIELTLHTFRLRFHSTCVQLTACLSN